MVEDTSSMADKIGQFSIENQEMARELSLDQSDAPGESLFQSMKSWNIPVGWYLWVKFTECMRLIVQYGCDQKHPSIEIQQTLDRLTCFDTPQQLDDLVNRCVDVYKTLIYIIQINDHLPITESNIRCYGGNASQSVQEKRHRLVSYMLHKSETCLFALLCVTNTDGYPQTCFESDDANVQEYIVKYMRAFNDQVYRKSTSSIDYISDNHDATTNIQESENSDSLDMLLPLLPNINVLSDNDDLTLSTGTLAVQNQSDLASIWLKEAFPDSIMSIPNSSFDMAFAADDIPHRPKTTTASSENHAEEMPEHPAMETTDGKLMINDDLQERKLISNNIVRKVKRLKTAQTSTNILTSNTDSSQHLFSLSDTLIQPASKIESQTETICNSVQECDSIKIITNPKCHRRARMLGDLAKKKCPLVQAGEKRQQKVYPKIEIKSASAEYLRVRAVTKNYEPHPLQCVAPENARVNLELQKTEHERKCLQCDPYSFDSSLECTYLPIDDEERRNHQKIVKVRLFNWKKSGSISKEVSPRENLRLCRLEFRLCKLSSEGEYKCISSPCYTSIIDQEDEDKTNQSDPEQLCEMGEQKIIIPLKTCCSEEDVQFNEEELDQNSFTIDARELSLTSPARTEGCDESHNLFEHECLNSAQSAIKRLFPFKSS